jgi:hypothetical protein
MGSRVSGRGHARIFSSRSLRKRSSRRARQHPRPAAASSAAAAARTWNPLTIPGLWGTRRTRPNFTSSRRIVGSEIGAAGEAVKQLSEGGVHHGLAWSPTHVFTDAGGFDAAAQKVRLARVLARGHSGRSRISLARVGEFRPAPIYSGGWMAPPLTASEFATVAADAPSGGGGAKRRRVEAAKSTHTGRLERILGHSIGQDGRVVFLTECQGKSPNFLLPTRSLLADARARTLVEGYARRHQFRLRDVESAEERAESARISFDRGRGTISEAIPRQGKWPTGPAGSVGIAVVTPSCKKVRMRGVTSPTTGTHPHLTLIFHTHPPPLSALYMLTDLDPESKSRSRRAADGCRHTQRRA